MFGRREPAAGGLSLPRATLLGALAHAAEEAELIEKMIDGLGTVQVYWSNSQVREFLPRASSKGWCRKLSIVRSSDGSHSNLYYDNPYDAIKWLAANTGWTIPSESQLPDVLGVPAEVITKCHEGTSVYVKCGDQLAVVESGLLVGEIYDRCASSLELPESWAAHVGDEDVSEDYRSQPGDVIAFCEDFVITSKRIEPEPPPPRVKPRWDGDRRELWLGDKLIKEFRRKGDNQVLILAAFEEEDWPAKIDDPLPPKGNMDPKRRLGDAVRRLNRHHKSEGLIEFECDGTGSGILCKVQKTV